ncbi:hypothetical protein NDI52_06825 [Leptolyngbya sp. PL-A3]|uniref:hypothetical protein n=1 Tax=Leptolyngbya sp. PL-A3 TaxID=2933911 RepID=UPI0032987751
MLRRLGLWAIWVSFLVYVLGFAPPLPADTLQPLQTLLSGQIPWINPVLISIFSMIGIWILIYSCLVFADGRMQSLPAWAFILASAGSGVLALIPYLALREPNDKFSGSKDGWLALLDSHTTGFILTFSTLVLLGFALFFGDWGGFLHEFQTNKFVHGMSLAFCLFTLLFPYPTLLQDDMGRRGLTHDSQLFRWVAWVPLFGPLLYLCVRPPLLARRS